MAWVTTHRASTLSPAHFRHPYCQAFRHPYGQARGKLRMVQKRTTTPTKLTTNRMRYFFRVLEDHFGFTASTNDSRAEI